MGKRHEKHQPTPRNVTPRVSQEVLRRARVMEGEGEGGAGCGTSHTWSCDAEQPARGWLSPNCRSSDEVSLQLQTSSLSR